MWTDTWQFETCHYDVSQEYDWKCHLKVNKVALKMKCCFLFYLPFIYYNYLHDKINKYLLNYLHFDKTASCHGTAPVPLTYMHKLSRCLLAMVIEVLPRNPWMSCIAPMSCRHAPGVTWCVSSCSLSTRWSVKAGNLVRRKLCGAHPAKMTSTALSGEILIFVRNTRHL